jgi:hypothetical protein
MLSSIASFFGYDESDSIPDAKNFEADQDGRVRYLNETYDPPALVHSRANYIATHYPEIWNKCRPNKFGSVIFPIKVTWFTSDDGEEETKYYRLKMDVEYMDDMLRTMDDEDNDWKWQILDQDTELPNETYFYNNNEFTNDWMYYYFGFGFMQVEPSNIAY